MNNRYFRNKEYDILIKISCKSISTIHKYCKRAYPNETGGVLFGAYHENNIAIITDIWEDKNISNKSKTRFIRGTDGLKATSDILWEKGLYYLGEWHYHPNSVSRASGIDINTLKKISENKIYKCPEPIMLIVGGSDESFFLESFYLINKGSVIYFNEYILNI